MPAFASVPSPDRLRTTDELADRVLSLPMANDLSPHDMDAIVAALTVASQSTVH
jgi:dTDP-4-amino-4,6-dideoxygalactose transaminase